MQDLQKLKTPSLGDHVCLGNGCARCPRCGNPLPGFLGDENRTANCILDRGHEGHCDSAPCGPECNGTWPHRPGEPARPFHVKGCPNDPPHPVTLSSLATAGLEQHSPAHGVCVDCMGRWPCADARRYTEILEVL